MTTECNQGSFEFHALLQRKSSLNFDGGTSFDAGYCCCEKWKNDGDHRGLADVLSTTDPEPSNTRAELLAQRIYGRAWI